MRTRGDQEWDGFPQNPKVDGFHWLEHNGGEKLIPFEWDAQDELWMFDDDNICFPDTARKRYKYYGPCLPPETYVAAEQRRKDAAGRDPVIYEYQDSVGQWVRSESQEHAENWAKILGTNYQALYTNPANVAALEVEIASLKEAEQLARADAEASKARVTVLERENNTLKTRVINAAENLLSIETPCMKGDNFAVTICSYFEDCEGETCDSGWHEGATKAYEEIKDAVLQHFRAALTREGGV